MRHVAGATAHGSAKDQLGVGFVGAGNFARGVLLPQLIKVDGIRLTGVCTANGRSARRAAERFGFSHATTDPAEVIDQEATDTVFIATRHDSHPSLAAGALRAGKHVFVEKPLSIREADIDAIWHAVEGARRNGHEPCLMVGFNRRFSPHARALQAGFANRTSPMTVNYRVNAGSVPAESWMQDSEEGGGRIIGEACHFVDFCTALIDSEPRKVMANGVSECDYSTASDSVVITIEYADGSLATIQYFADGHGRLAKERCEVFAGGRSAVMDDFRSTRFYGGGRNVRGKQQKGFEEELLAFLDVCRHGGNWPISWDCMVGTHRVCFGALRSLETGNMVAVA